MKLKLEEVYRTEGVPEYTFVAPPNFNEILVDLRNLRKPVIVEGQSGTGKTTTVKKILESDSSVAAYVYLSARRAADVERIVRISDGGELGSFIIDDFHRLSTTTQEAFANLVKLAAEEGDSAQYPKIIVIGINNVGSGLIQLVTFYRNAFGGFNNDGSQNILQSFQAQNDFTILGCKTFL